MKHLMFISMTLCMVSTTPTIFAAGAGAGAGTEAVAMAVQQAIRTIKTHLPPRTIQALVLDYYRPRIYPSPLQMRATDMIGSTPSARFSGILQPRIGMERQHILFDVVLQDGRIYNACYDVCSGNTTFKLSDVVHYYHMDRDTKTTHTIAIESTEFHSGQTQYNLGVRPMLTCSTSDDGQHLTAFVHSQDIELITALTADINEAKRSSADHYQEIKVTPAEITAPSAAQH